MDFRLTMARLRNYSHFKLAMNEAEKTESHNSQ